MAGLHFYRRGQRISPPGFGFPAGGRQKIFFRLLPRVRNRHYTRITAAHKSRQPKKRPLVGVCIVKNRPSEKRSRRRLTDPPEYLKTGHCHGGSPHIPRRCEPKAVKSFFAYRTICGPSKERGAPMKQIQRKSDKVLLALSIVFSAVYCGIFLTAFSELPLRISPWHQDFLLFFHFIPMFFWELLLCRTATWKWRLILPAIPLVLVGLWFLSLAEWYVMAWILYLAWCIPPVLGCLTAYVVFAVYRKFRKQ